MVHLWNAELNYTVVHDEQLELTVLTPRDNINAISEATPSNFSVISGRINRIFQKISEVLAQMQTAIARRIAWSYQEKAV